MTREELLDCLTDRPCDVCKFHTGNGCTKWKCIFEEPIDENKGEWIPVSERLPEKNMACLVSVGEFNLTKVAMYSDLMGTIDHRIFYQGDYGCRSFEDITQYVKAWQPLPEPYKAESEE